MKKVVAVFSLALLMTLLSGCVVQTSPTKAGNAVSMGPNNFSSGDSITIKAGTAITFTTESTGSTHILVIGMNGQFTAADGAADFNGSSGVKIDPGKSWASPVWTAPGTYHVTCTLHPTTMNLTVTVTAAGG